ncbi:MAG: hypothetical protein FWF29_08885 [Treponema sp.]|nr:hypothetical protein [Treponema sp.]
MKKVSLVVMERERENTLRKLRETGVVHLKRKNTAVVIPAELLEKQARNRQALGILSVYKVKKNMKTAGTEDIPLHGRFADEILSLTTEKIRLRDELPHFIAEKRRIEGWGDFNPGDFSFLEAHGVALFLYSLPVPVYRRIGDDVKLIILSRDSVSVKAFAVGKQIPGMEPFPLPFMPLSDINGRIESIGLRLAEIETRLRALSAHKEIIGEDNLAISEEIEYETASGGMETVNDETTKIAIAGLCGFVPCDKIDLLVQAACDNGWTLVWDDPTPGDRPPTILKNNKAVRIIQPLFSLLGTLPGYWEYDISLSYMVFLSVFFAMIFGDAGYGILILGISLIIGLFYRAIKGIFPDAVKLIMLFSSCTIAWGAINGAWFAIPVHNLPFVLRALVIPPFNNSGAVADFPVFLKKLFILPDVVPRGDLKTNWNIQFVCFTAGTIQILWARVKNIRRLLPFTAAIAQAGWIIAISGIYFVVLSILLKIELLPFVKWFVIAGVGLNFIFSEQKGGNFFVNIGKSMTNFFSIFLKVVGSFGDIISYIRLFAAGLAGSMIARTFNSMALGGSSGLGSNGLGIFSLGFILRLLIAIVVLAAGHALNLMMSTLSLIVHGVRLNLLEYAGNHLGMDWSGYAYKPFASVRNAEKNGEGN